MSILLGFDYRNFNRVNLVAKKGKRKKEMIKILIGALTGAVAGYFWYRLIGCRQGTCYIMRHRTLAIIYWTLFGALLANLF